MQHNASPCTPSPTSPLSYPTRTCRHKIPPLPPNMTIFIFQTDQRNACRPCCGQPCGRSWKEMWVSLTQTAWVNVSQPDKTANRNVPWGERLYSAAQWKQTPRQETKLAFNVNHVDPTSSVCAKKWLIYTRRIYFPNHLCKQLCRDPELCLKRPQQMAFWTPVNGPSMSAPVETCSLLESWVCEKTQRTPGRSSPDGWSSEKLLITSARYIESKRRSKAPLADLVQFSRAERLGTSGAPRNDENKVFLCLVVC